MDPATIAMLLASAGPQLMQLFGKSEQNSQPMYGQVPGMGRQQRPQGMSVPTQPSEQELQQQQTMQLLMAIMSKLAQSYQGGGGAPNGQPWPQAGQQPLAGPQPPQMPQPPQSLNNPMMVR